ncbi:MAG: hypothetical protein OXC68_02885 [Aestuariivita sp.]|nr:hypothetical protein [Aestuariivita sp.]
MDTIIHPIGEHFPLGKIGNGDRLINQPDDDKVTEPFEIGTFVLFNEQ